jgi:hypothetical protein
MVTDGPASHATEILPDPLTHNTQTRGRHLIEELPFHRNFPNFITRY